MGQTQEHHSWLYNQLFTNWKKFEIIYVSVLVALQIIVYLIVPDSIIGMISGVAGTLCLVYGMKGRKITFIFGIVQCLAMTYIAWISHAYGSFAMDIFYVISQPIGWYMWGHDEATKRFSPKVRRLIFLGAFVAWAIGWWVLAMVHGRQLYRTAALHYEVPRKLVAVDHRQRCQHHLLGHLSRSNDDGDQPHRLTGCQPVADCASVCVAVQLAVRYEGLGQW